jgi:hypothetical protein
MYYSPVNCFVVVGALDETSSCTHCCTNAVGGPIPSEAPTSRTNRTARTAIRANHDVICQGRRSASVTSGGFVNCGAPEGIRTPNLLTYLTQLHASTEVRESIAPQRDTQ